MKAKSGLRQMYKAQVYVGLVLSFLIASALFYASEFDWQNILFWIGCLFAALCAHILYDLIKPENLLSDISVDDNGITMRFKGPESVETIPFSQIEKIKVRRKRIYMQRGVPINDGFCETFIYLKDGKTAVISQDHFEDYHEIMLAIRSNFKG